MALFCSGRIRQRFHSKFAFISSLKTGTNLSLNHFSFDSQVRVPNSQNALSLLNMAKASLAKKLLRSVWVCFFLISVHHVKYFYSFFF